MCGYLKIIHHTSLHCSISNKEFHFSIKIPSQRVDISPSGHINTNKIFSCHWFLIFPTLLICGVVILTLWWGGLCLCGWVRGLLLHIRGGQVSPVFKLAPYNITIHLITLLDSIDHHRLCLRLWKDGLKIASYNMEGVTLWCLSSYARSHMLLDAFKISTSFCNQIAFNNKARVLHTHTHTHTFKRVS